jgi:hypothetical protein
MAERLPSRIALRRSGPVRRSIVGAFIVAIASSLKRSVAQAAGRSLPLQIPR